MIPVRITASYPPSSPPVCPLQVFGQSGRTVANGSPRFANTAAGRHGAATLFFRRSLREGLLRGVPRVPQIGTALPRDWMRVGPLRLSDHSFAFAFLRRARRDTNKMQYSEYMRIRMRGVLEGKEMKFEGSTSTEGTPDHGVATPAVPFPFEAPHRAPLDRHVVTLD